MVLARFGPVLPQKRLRKSAYVALLLLFITGQYYHKNLQPEQFMAVLLRRALLTAFHRATGQGSVSVYPTLSATLIGACRTKKTWPVSFSKEELRERLTPMQYHVTQERGTESAFTGELTFNKEEGTYSCVVCGTPLFSSKTKFDSGSGWPSFFDLLKKEAVTVTDDFSYGMHRVETTCSQCGAHLGHLFDDGPKPTRKRYCINSASLAFTPSTDQGQTLPQTEGTPEKPEGAAAGGGPNKEDKTEL